MLVRQIVDPAKDRQMRAHFIFRCQVDEAVIFDVEIRSAEIQFFTRVHEFCLCRDPESLPPKIRTGKVNFVARPARQTRALRLANIARRSFFRVEIRIARGKNQLGDRLRA